MRYAEHFYKEILLASTFDISDHQWMQRSHAINPRSRGVLRKVLQSLLQYRLHYTISTTFEEQKPASKRARKRRRASPSTVLVEALESQHLCHAVPHVACHRNDLSYRNAWKRPPPGHVQRAVRLFPLRDQERGNRLQHIIALYMRTFIDCFPEANSDRRRASVEDSFVSQIGSIPTLSNASQVLSSKGYSWRDVQLWHNIIVSRDDVLASRELLAHSVARISSKTDRMPLPFMILLFYLRRPKLDQEALRNALLYAWEEVHRMKDSMNSIPRDPSSHSAGLSKEDVMPSVDRSAMFIMIVRLLRHARQAMPEALITIARLFLTIPTFQIEHRATWRKRTRQRRAAARVNALYNRVLKLLSIPTNVSAYHSVNFMQQAQFDILGFMASHKPVIQINREGYRAVSQVQLANKKSERDRDWASLKAKTWPPWKVDKLGFDAEKGPQYGASQAFEAIQRAREAGYGSKTWEKIATILSGWDLDGSPTIQKRAFHLHRQVSGKSNREGYLALLWSARIQATRTVQEAWACFLAYEDEIAGTFDANHSVYLAMIEKLHFGHETQRRANLTGFHQSASNIDFGGDGKEVLPVSHSPKEQTYVRSPPPSMDELANDMRAKGVAMSAECFAFLIANAHTFNNGLKYLDWAYRRYPSLECLVYPDPEDVEKVNRTPLKLFEAYIGFLCKFANKPQSALLRRKAASSLSLASTDGEPLVFLAYRFLQTRKKNSQYVWHNVAYRMMASPLPWNLRMTTAGDPDAQTLDRWGVIRNIQRQMRKKEGLRIDGRNFIFFNRILSLATLAAYRIRHRNLQTQCSRGEKIEVGPDVQPNVTKMAESLLRTGAKYAQDMFNELFGGKRRHRPKGEYGEADELFTLLATPYPAILHAYVRSLGLLRDWNKLEEFAQWMILHHDRIDKAVEMPGNGPRMLRRTLIAMRVFLERAWLVQNQEDAPSFAPKSAASPERIEGVRSMIEKVEEWGGWPTEEEVYDYCYGELPEE